MFHVLCIVMLSAIQLDNQLFGRAEKISDVWPDGLLPAKAKSRKALVPQCLPKLALCVSRILTQLAREFVCHHTPHRVIRSANASASPSRGEAISNILQQRICTGKNAFCVFRVLRHLRFQRVEVFELPFGAQIGDQRNRQMLAVKIAGEIEQVRF
jgi:hypothetical protein